MRLIGGSLACVLLLAGCGGASSKDWLEGYTFPEPADFSDEDRVTAFTLAHQKLSREYALADWKGIRWDAIYERHLARVTEAATAGDPQAYLAALRAYVSEFGDGHVSIPISTKNGALYDRLIGIQSGGSYGLGLAELDDGTVVAARVAEGGPARAAGMVDGARILTWGEDRIGAAIDAVRPGVLAAAAFTATAAHQRLEQVRLLTRAPVGTAVQVGYQNPGAAAPQRASMTAVDDGLAGLSLLDFAPPNSAEDESEVLRSKILPSGFGYVRLTVMADPNDMQAYPDHIRVKFLNMIDALDRAHVPGLVLDLRGNHGGFDTLTANLCGAFSGESAFYEITELYDKRTNGFLRFTVDDQTGELVDALMTMPQPTRFLRPVVALVNPRTISSGEGLARCVNQLETGGVVGFFGTRGSFALAGGAIALPDDLVIRYPYGRSVDAQGVVQIDSRQGQGGVLPKYRVPRILATVMSYAAGQDVELEYAVEVLSRLANQH